MCTASQPSCPSHSAAEGFSLVEVLIATGILITAAAAIPQLFTAATRANVEAGAITWATTLAAQKLEELEAQSSLDAVGDESIDYLDSSRRVGHSRFASAGLQASVVDRATAMGTRRYARSWRGRVSISRR